MPLKRILLTITATAAFLLFAGIMGIEGLCGEETFGKDVEQIQRTMMVDGDYEGSLSRLHALLEASPVDLRIYTALGLAHYGLMEYTEAYQYFKRSEEAGAKGDPQKLLSYAISKMDENRDILAEIADVYYSAMFYGEAAENYKKAIEEDPGNVYLYQTLADCRVATGDFDSAQEYYEKAYEDVSRLTEKGRFQEAEEICRSRISLDPADHVAVTQLGRIYWEKEKRRAAIKLFRKAVKLAPDYPIAHLFLGKAYFFERKPEKGMAEFEAFKERMELLSKMDEETSDFYVSKLHYICYIYSTLKRYKEALSECKKIVKLRPDDQKAYYNMAVCYYIHYHNRPALTVNSRRS